MRRPLLFILLLLFCTGLVYSPLLQAHFLDWDDNINVYRNPHYLPVTLESTWQFWTEPFNKTYRPLVHTAWAGLAYIATSPTRLYVPGSGPTSLDASIFHTANVVLHLINVLLVFALARQWVRSAGAAAGAAVFALHPLQVESVAWVTGFNELLCGTFCLLAALCYVRWAQPGQAKPASALYVLGLLCYVLALLTKPAAVALPLVLGVLDFFLLRKSMPVALRALGPWLALGGAWAVVTAWVHPDEYAGTPPPLYLRPFIAGDALAFYLLKFLVPINLGIDYGRKPDVVLAQFWVWLSWLLPVAALAVAWWWRKKSVWPLVALLAPLAWLLPVIGLKPFHFQLVYSTVADRYLYFALAIIGVAVAAGLQNSSKRAVHAAFAAIVAVWALLALGQAQTWRDNFTVFTHALRVNPRSWMAHANLGSALDTAGEKTEAAKHFRAALDIKPDLWQMHVMLARYARAAGDSETARREWQEVLRIQPQNAEALKALETTPD